MNKFGCLLGIGYLFVIVLVITNYPQSLEEALVMSSILIIVGFGVGYLSKKSNEKYLLENLLHGNKADDERLPIFYLREFREDGTKESKNLRAEVSPLIEPLGIAFSTNVSFEINLVDELNSVGPVFALSRADSTKEAGAIRITSQDDNWKEIFYKYLQDSQLIVLRAGTTENVMWEIHEIVRLNLANKLIIYIQFGEETERILQRVRYQIFLEKTETLFPKNLPHFDNNKKFIWFKDDWEAQNTSSINEILYAKGILIKQNFATQLRRIFLFRV